MVSPTFTHERTLDLEVAFLSAKQVRARYGGVSDMTIWRWSRDDELGFPHPIRINGRRFWSEQALSAWERHQSTLQSPRPERGEPPNTGLKAARAHQDAHAHVSVPQEACLSQSGVE